MLTPKQIEDLQAPLNKANVKQREKGSAKLDYIEAWLAIDEANRIFGFDGWNRETIYCKEISRVPCKIGKGSYERDGFKVGYEAKVRIYVGNAYREGTGHGSGQMSDLFDAIESAAKEAESDAMKRALMTFGNPFGLALYDKQKRNVEDLSREPEFDIEKEYNLCIQQIKTASNKVNLIEEWNSEGSKTRRAAIKQLRPDYYAEIMAKRDEKIREFSND